MLRLQQSTTQTINTATEHFNRKVNHIQQQLDPCTAAPSQTQIKIPLLTTPPAPIKPPPGFRQVALNPPSSFTAYRLTTPTHTSHSDNHSAPSTSTDTTVKETYATTVRKPTTPPPMV